jgi:predicted transposase YbfD/YdcC
MDRTPYRTILDWLLLLPDPRGRQGRRYGWELLLRLLAMAFASDCRGALAIQEWVACQQEELAAGLGRQWRGVPSESTFQRLLRQIDVEVLEELAAGHNLAVARDTARAAEQPLVALALDGKWVRTASAHGSRVLLLGLSTQREGLPLCQARVPAGRNEESVAPAMLQRLDLGGCLVTMDAGITSRAVARAIVAAGGHYLMVVKGDTADWHQELAAVFATAPGRRFDRQRRHFATIEKGHGRREERSLWVSGESCDWLGLAGAGAMLMRQTTRTEVKSGRRGETQTTYAVTSLTPDRVPLPWLAGCWRGHWSIENKVHWVRDVTFGEDRCAVWRGGAPQVLAALRNMLLAAVRRDDRWPSMASALRWARAKPIHAMQLTGA